MLSLEIERQRNIRCIRSVGPTLDPREESFDARAVTIDAVVYQVHFPRWRFRCGPVPGCILFELRDEVFGTGEDENVGLLGVPIARQPFVCLPSDGGQR